MKNTVLIIENDANVQKQAFELLENAGVDAWCATDAESALMLIGLIKPSVILVSLDLKKMNGFRLAKILKKELSTQHIVCLALTNLKTHNLKSVREQMDGLIIKPINEKKFADEVKSYFLKKTIIPIRNSYYGMMVNGL